MHTAVPTGKDIPASTPPIIAAVLAHLLRLSSPYPATKDGIVNAKKKNAKKSQNTTIKPRPAPSLPLGIEETNIVRNKSMKSDENKR